MWPAAITTRSSSRASALRIRAKPCNPCNRLVCTPGGSHRPWAGAKNSGGSFVSEEMAAYPKPLATHFASLVEGVSLAGRMPRSVALRAIRGGPPSSQRSAVSILDGALQGLSIDGGGLPSSGDWRVPPEKAHGDLAPLRRRLLPLIDEKTLVHRFPAWAAQASQGAPMSGSPFPEAAIENATQAVQQFLNDSGFAAHGKIEAGQHFRLELVRDLAKLIQDWDWEKCDTAVSGFLTRAYEEFPPSGVWKFRHAPSASTGPEGLSKTEGNWQSAKSAPGIVTGVVNEEIEAGFAQQRK